MILTVQSTLGEDKGEEKIPPQEKNPKKEE